MNILHRITLALSTAIIYGAYGQNEPIRLRYEQYTVPIENSPTDESSSLWRRFEHTFGESAGELYADHFHPLKVMSRSLVTADDSWDQVLEHGNRTARSTFVRSVGYSLREAAATLPVMDWLEAQQSALGGLLLDSLDAVDEEAVSPLNPSYRSGERVWWQSLTAKRELRYGIRPLRTDPYAFLSLRIGDGDRTFLLGHVRYFYRNFGDHRFELALSLPLANGIAIDAGTAYQFGQHNEEKKLVLKLSRPLRHGGVVHVGVEAQKSPIMFAGISLPW